jgi:hypothetical protein
MLMNDHDAADVSGVESPQGSIASPAGDNGVMELTANSQLDGRLILASTRSKEHRFPAIIKDLNVNVGNDEPNNNLEWIDGSEMSLQYFLRIHAPTMADQTETRFAVNLFLWRQDEDERKLLKMNVVVYRRPNTVEWGIYYENDYVKADCSQIGQLQAQRRGDYIDIYIVFKWEVCVSFYLLNSHTLCRLTSRIP